jgi:hypothetical protein
MNRNAKKRACNSSSPGLGKIDAGNTLSDQLKSGQRLSFQTGQGKVPET